MGAEQPVPYEPSEETLAEVVVMRHEADTAAKWAKRVGGAFLEAAKVLLMGAEYTDHQTEDRKHLKIVD